MKVVVVLDGERHEVEVDPVRSTVRVGTHEWPIRLDTSSEGAVSFEILGERVDVHGDPIGTGKPAGSVTINGELHSLVVESSSGSAVRPSTGAPSAVSGPSAPTPDEGPGRAILPPMPGKVLEVRVRDGEKVQAGQVLLVLEAMKMRNEVTSPVGGAVSGLHVTPGANVGAREVLLRVLPA